MMNLPSEASVTQLYLCTVLLTVSYDQVHKLVLLKQT